MSEQPQPEEDRGRVPRGRAKKTRRTAAGSKSPPASVAIIPAGTDLTKPGAPLPANTLTPDEQMERFAKDLKENDWGHQPC